MKKQTMSQQTYILCPGQGAQTVGMGKDYYQAFAVSRDLYNLAEKILGYDLATICFDGPEDRLNQTDIAQPAIFVTSVACFAAATETGLIDPGKIGALAGLSLGEYTALHLAGAISFEDGLRLVAARGKYMQQAALATPSGMVSILGADEPTVNRLCQQNANGQVLVPANFNCPGQIVVSGAIEACNRIASVAEAEGFKTVRLKVAGAFHSPLMRSAADLMAEELHKTRFQKPSVAVYANVTAQPHGDVEAIKRLLVEQIVCPVRWEQTMRHLLDRGQARWVELAPGRVLTGLVKKINRRLEVETLASAEAIRATAQPGSSQ